MKLKNNIPYMLSKIDLEKVNKIVSKYPKNKHKSAILGILDLVQRSNKGWLSNSSIEWVANYLSIPYIKVYEIASFYSMYNLEPIGKYHIQVCGTTPCWLRGASKILETCEKYTKTKCGSTSDNKLFTISEVECLGACRNAPVAQINDDYHENLDETRVINIINELTNK